MADLALNKGAKDKSELINKRINFRYSLERLFKAKTAKNAAFLSFLMLF